MKKSLLFTVSLIVLFLCCCGEKYHKKTVTFPADATLEEKIELAANVVPTPQQLAWQKLETTVFFHFGINTFTGREWGDGTENPDIFNPTELNTDQWVETVQKAGFKLVIITAKHHDGFCLWPTETTTHSVASSSWQNGQGDVIRALQKSCKKYGMKFGIYLSPWDRNSPAYGNSPAYNKIFESQLTELLTNYGTIDEVWFDGACGEGPNGKKQEYDFPAYYRLIEQLMPNAVTAVSGNDVRWVGNESGLGRDTEWSVTVLSNDAVPENKKINNTLGINALTKDLGSREMIQKATKVTWWPSEVDVSIRPGWFYHAEEDNRVKNTEQLVDIYFNSVGKNSVLLLNIPPDKRGKIAAIDSIRLADFGSFLSKMYSENFISGKTYWKSKSQTESNVFNLKKETVINVIELAEDISKGQRIENFTVEIKSNDSWKQIAQGTTIGYKRLLRFPAQKATKIRINISQSRGSFRMLHAKAYLANEFITQPHIQRSKDGFVSISANNNAIIKYTTDNSTPTEASTTYEKPFLFEKKGTIKAIAFYNNSEKKSDITTRIFFDSKKEWKIINCSDQTAGYEATKAIDNDENSIWHTPWSGKVKKHPHFITVDCGKIQNISGFIFTPRRDMLSGTPYHYEFYLSTNGKTWKKMQLNGEFSNIKNNPISQTVQFESTPMRYFKFVAVDEVNNHDWTAIAEIDILTNN